LAGGGGVGAFYWPMKGKPQDPPQMKGGGSPDVEATEGGGGLEQKTGNRQGGLGNAEPARTELGSSCTAKTILEEAQLIWR